MKKATMIVVCAVMITHAYSQTGNDTAAVHSNFGLLTYFGVGASYNNFKNMNDILPKFSIPALSKYNVAATLNEDFRLHNLLIGLNLLYTASEKNASDYNEMLLNFSGDINFGYYVFNKKKFHLAPEAGVGFYSSSAYLTHTSGYADFADILNDKVAVNMYQTAALLNFGLRFDFADFTKRRTDLTTIKLGYKYGLKQQGWGIDESSNSTFADSPKDRLNQYYVLFCFGMSRTKHRA